MIANRLSRMGATLLALLVVAGCGAVTDRAQASDDQQVYTVPASRRPVENPLLSPVGATRNVAFYYRGDVPLNPAHVGRLRSELGHPGLVVTTRQRDPAAAVEAIHRLGAKAYLYVQYYWAPNDRPYGGLDLAAHPDWAFCGPGRRPLVGRITEGGTKWYLLDTNENPLRRQILETMREYRAQGWDGVMFDRGAASTQAGSLIDGVDLWRSSSSCTAHPFRQGASFSDAFVNVLALAGNAGLQVMINNGRSPFDPLIRMRPDPRSGQCRLRRWASCTTLSDIWRNTNLVLNETPAHTEATRLARDMTANLESERDARHGRRTVALITTADLGGASGQTRRNVFYEWGQVKLFDLAAGVNTGSAGCGHAAPGEACNQYGVYPELVDVRFGRPILARPRSTGCGLPYSCVWFRHYSAGLQVVNATPRMQRHVSIRLRLPRCRYVYDVFLRRWLGNARCVRRVQLTLTPWTGRPLIYSVKPPSP